MLKIQETKIHSVSKNKFEELRVVFLIKKEDYTPEIEADFYRLVREGNLGAMAFQEIEEVDVENLKQLRSKLGALMSLYCEKIGSSIEEEIQSIYRKYSINSRSELTREQLEYEIESYKTGLQYE